MNGAEAAGFLANYHKEERPWGEFEQFTHNEQTTVKIITVKPNEAFSLQTHANRDEFWHVIQGSGVFTIGEEKVEAQVGSRFYCPRETKHRAEAGPQGLTFIEIAFGNFDEQDITRLEDKYGRT